MKPSRFAVASLVFLGMLAAACGGRSGLKLGDGGVGRAGDGGPIGQGGSGGIAPDGGVGGSGGSKGGTGGGGTGGTGGGTGGTGGIGGGMTLVGIDVTPMAPTAGINTTVLFKATARYANGISGDVTRESTWTSSSTSVASIIGGLATARAAGATIITATYNNLSGRTPMTVTAAALVSLTIEPAQLTVPVGQRGNFTATGVYSDGRKQDLTSQAMWMSTDPSVATVSGGDVSGLRAGNTTVVATFQNVASKAGVTVTNAKITALQISPTTPSVPVGGGIDFTAIAIFSDGNRSDVTTQASWSSSNQMVLGFDPCTPGRALARSPGAAAVTASFSGLSASTMVTVSPARLASIRVTPEAATTPVGTVLPFRATGVFADGTSSDITASVTWSSTDEKIAAISNAPGMQGLATGLSAGGVGITATLGGISGVAKLAVTETKVVSLSITPKTVTIGIMGVQQLTATATFSDGSTRDVTDAATWMAGDPSIIELGNSGGRGGLVVGLQAGNTAAVASYGGAADKIPVTVTTATLTSLEVSPPSLNLMTGQKSNLTATGRYSDGSTMDVTAQVTWTADNAMVATVSNVPGSSGVVVAISAGSTVIIAQLGNAATKVAVTVTGTTDQQLSVQPPLATARVGQNTQFTATLLRANGTIQNVTGMATWTSSNPMIAPLGGMGPGALSRATCRAEGTVTITAMYMGLTDSATLTCTPARVLTGLSVTPFLATLTVGQGIQFQATALYDDNSTQNVTGQTTWTSSDPMIADVRNMGGMGGRGQVTGLAAGDSTITGSYMGFTASGTVTVTAGKLTGIMVTPPALSLRVGESQPLTVTGLYSDNTTRNVTGQSVFSSDDQTVADVSNAGGGPGGGTRGQVTGLSSGDATITATFMGFTATATVTVVEAKVMEIQVTPTNPTIPAGVVQPFQATAIYSDFTSRNVTGLALWTSSDTKVAQVSNAGARGQATGLSAGTTAITATFMGIAGSSTLTVTSATIEQVQVSPMVVSTPVGVSVRFTATAILSDNTSRDVTGTSTWTSSDDTVAPVSNVGGSRGLATALKAGTATITATAGGVAGTATYTVGAQTLTGITVTPAMTSLKAGTSSSFTATGSYSDGSTYELTDNVTWISTMTGVATVSNANGSRGLVTAVATGSTTVEAHFQGKTGTSAVMVTP